MLLAFDIGNTNLTIGVWRGDELAAQWRYATRRDATSDELGANLYVSFQTAGFSFQDVTGVAISSVVPTLTPQSVRFARDYFGIEPLVVSHELDLGLKNRYDDPRAVGADRLVNGLAAWKRANRAVVVADFGTATTVDAVSGDGTYLGGAIAPGIGISTDALFRAAAKLPRVELLAPPRALATNTAQSIQAGLVFGYAGLTKELIARCANEIEAEFGEIPAIYATGGLAELIAPLVPQIEKIEANLTLEGLKMIWEEFNRR